MSDVDMNTASSSTKKDSSDKRTPLEGKKKQDYESAKEYYTDIGLAYMTKVAKKRALERELQNLNSEIEELEKGFLYLRQLKNNIKSNAGNYIGEGDRKKILDDSHAISKSADGKDLTKEQKEKLKKNDKRLREIDNEGERVKDVVKRLRGEDW